MTAHEQNAGGDASNTNEADDARDETPVVVEYISDPDGGSVKRFVHFRNGSWDIRAKRYIDEGYDDYKAMCDECGDLFSTFGRAEHHALACDDDE
jgi:hypothetical protein